MFCHLSGKKLSVCVHMCVTLGDAAEQLGKRGQEWSRGPPAVDRWRWKEQSRFNLDRGRTMVDQGGPWWTMGLDTGNGQQQLFVPPVQAPKGNNE